ncbi:hypothetical protein RND81_04G006900 [Saponaria officinalis]|uniref:hydroxyethylthiazole kinase n=1 Tax=Saponaria officinalis TaxID=3572 RepID=A0AAW1LFP1_SAPOF
MDTKINFEDSLHESVDALEAAKSLAQASGAVVAVSGAMDIVTDGNQVIGAHNGVPMMQKITSGCSVTALIAAFVAVEPTHALEAAVSALSIFGVAGELGMESAKGPASLRVNLIDSLCGLDEGTVLKFFHYFEAEEFYSRYYSQTPKLLVNLHYVIIVHGSNPFICGLMF